MNESMRKKKRRSEGTEVNREARLEQAREYNSKRKKIARHRQSLQEQF